MNRTCRICSDRPGIFRTVTVGDGLSRRWSICERCLDTLRGAPWLRIDECDDSERVVLHLDPESLVGSFWREG